MAYLLPKKGEDLTRKSTSGGTRLPTAGTQVAGPPQFTQPRPSAVMAHQLLDTPAGELVQKFAPQYASKIPPEKAKQTFREVLKTSDFMTKSLIMSIVGQHLPKGVTAEDIGKAVNEAPPPAEKPATAAAPAVAPAPAAAAAAPAAAAAAPAAAAPTAAPAAAPAAAVEPAGTSTPQPDVQAGAGPAAVAAAAAAAPAAPAAGGGGRTTITPELMRAIMKIESGGNPNARTGSYKGLYQLSDSEFARLGGKGNIYDAKENERIATLKLQQEADQVAKQLGRALTPGEIYLVHQQGVGGAPAHIKNPTQAAWKSMLSTGEGQQKGERWAKLAIWGNIPDKDKARFGSVDNVTSADFAKLWNDQIERRGGGGGKGSTTTEPAPLDPTPNVGSGQKDYDDAKAAETAKGMVDPTPNVGSGASDYPAATPVQDTIAKADSKDFASGIGDIFSGLSQSFGGGGAGKGSSPTGSGVIPMSLAAPQGAVPTVDPRMVEMQRQQLALAMQRLNSGKLF